MKNDTELKSYIILSLVIWLGIIIAVIIFLAGIDEGLLVNNKNKEEKGTENAIVP